MTWFQTLITILVGIGVIVSFIAGAAKVVNAVNKKCPCNNVLNLQEKMKKYNEYFSNDSRSIKDLDKRLAIVEGQMLEMNKKIDRIDENVMIILKSNVFK